jgi:hypothetical protein
MTKLISERGLNSALGSFIGNINVLIKVPCAHDTPALTDTPFRACECAAL